MHVIEYAQYGGPEVLQLMERPAPSAGPGEVRVRLLAAGISPIDVKLRAGLLRAHFALQFPKIPGRDGVGVIDQIGAQHERAQRPLGQFAELVARLGRYLERLDAAYDNVLAGDLDFVSGARIDSYHTVWFELHEDLLRMLGREREEQ